MSDIEYKQTIDDFLVENHSTLMKYARRAAHKCIGSYNVDETQHELFMIVVEYPAATTIPATLVTLPAHL